MLKSFMLTINNYFIDKFFKKPICYQIFLKLRTKQNNVLYFIKFNLIYNKLVYLLFKIR